MTRSFDPDPLNPRRTRRETLRALGAGAVVLGMDFAPGSALGQGSEETVLTEALVLREPDIPAQVVQDDGKIRLVLKDWPVLGPVSVIAARMALASKFQDKYLQAHEALIGVNSKLTEPRIRELLAGAGIDVDRLNRDLVTNAKAIDAILARNDDQAKAFGFRGTPSFIVGKFRVPGILTMAQFDQVIADARKAAANK